MAGKLNWSADVATDQLSDTPNHRAVHIMVRNEVAVISRGGEQIIRKEGVRAVEQTEPRAALIRFDDGTTWAAKLPERKRGGCGCS